MTITSVAVRREWKGGGVTGKVYGHIAPKHCKKRHVDVVARYKLIAYTWHKRREMSLCSMSGDTVCSHLVLLDDGLQDPQHEHIDLKIWDIPPGC